MDIEELKAHKQAMEREIHEAITTAINKFRETTGMSPDNICVEMIEVTQFGQRYRHYYASSVRTDVAI